MRKRTRKVLSGLLAGVVCLTAAYTGHTAYAEGNEFLTTSDSSGVTITGITDAAVKDGKVTIPDQLDGTDVVGLGKEGTSRSFLDGKDVETLAIGKNVRKLTLYSLYDTPGLKKIEVADGSVFSTDDEGTALTVTGGSGKILLKVCPAAVNSYHVPDDVNTIWNMDHMTLSELELSHTAELRKLALAGTEIGTLSIENAKSSENNTDILYGTTVKAFNTDDSTLYETDGKALWTKADKKLIKVAAGADFEDGYFSRFSDASPYAFNSVPEYLKIAGSLPESATKNKVFSFYSQNDAVFMVNGEVSFCYNHDKSVPGSVGDSTEYSKNIDQTKYDQIRALMYAGVPVDGTGLFKKTFGMSYEEAMDLEEVKEHGDAALNTVSAVLYKILDNAEPDTIRGTGFGPFDADLVAIYRQSLLKAVEDYKDYNFEPNFTLADNTISFHRSGNGYESDPFTIHTVNQSGEEADNYVYTINITTDGITTKDGNTSFRTGEEVTLVTNSEPDALAFSYNEPSLKYYKKTNDNVQDVLASAVRSKAANLNVTVNVEDLVISKQDATTKAELPGASLRLTKDGNVVDEWVSTDTPHKITNPADGTYTLTEITAPDGYDVAENIEFVVKDGAVEGGKVIMYDNPKKEEKKISISKKDITTKEELPGAALTLTKDGELVEQWISTDTPHEIANPADGSYTLTEVTAPDGYEVAEKIDFVVKDGAIADGSSMVIMYDAPKKTPDQPDVPKGSEISVSKQDITNKKELPGAKLTITKDGTEVESWTSTDTPHKVFLEDGTYVLTEVTAPSGYEVAENIEFTVSDGKVDGKSQVTMYDRPSGNSIEISKVSATTGNELPGAELILKDASGNTVDKWTSGTTVHVIKNIPDGTYTLTEIRAPKGYDIAESVEFEVKDGKVDGGIVVMVDKESEQIATPSNPDKPSTPETPGTPTKPSSSGNHGSSGTPRTVHADWYIDISKQDITTKSELPGAKLTVTKDGEVIDSWTSSEKPHRVKNLANGEYVLTEVTAPIGYEVAESIKFTVSGMTLTDGTTTVVMYDVPKTVETTPEETTPAETTSTDITPSDTPLPKTGNTAAAGVFALASAICIFMIYRKRRTEI